MPIPIACELPLNPNLEPLNPWTAPRTQNTS